MFLFRDLPIAGQQAAGRAGAMVVAGVHNQSFDTCLYSIVPTYRQTDPLRELGWKTGHSILTRAANVERVKYNRTQTGYYARARNQVLVYALQKWLMM